MMSEKDILEVRDVQTADKPQHETVRKLCNELLQARRQLAPVIDWYQPDDQPERPFFSILNEMVSDLQEDRAELLKKQRLVKEMSLHTLTLCRRLPQDDPHREACLRWLVDNNLMMSPMRSEPTPAVKKAIDRFHAKLAELGQPELSGNNVADEIEDEAERLHHKAVGVVLSYVMENVDMDAVGPEFGEAVNRLQASQSHPGHVGEDVVYELPYPPKDAYAVGSAQWAHDVTDRVVRRVAELPDRTSPDNWPEAMLVTADELREIIAEETRRPAHVAETGE